MDSSCRPKRGFRPLSELSRLVAQPQRLRVPRDQRGRAGVAHEQNERPTSASLLRPVGRFVWVLSVGGLSAVSQLPNCVPILCPTVPIFVLFDGRRRLPCCAVH